MQSALARLAATIDPSIVLGVVKKEFEAWKGRLRKLVAENRTATEDVIAWKLIEEMGIRGSEMLLPVFERERRVNSL
jgi:transaldolase